MYLLIHFGALISMLAVVSVCILNFVPLLESKLIYTAGFVYGAATLLPLFLPIYNKKQTIGNRQAH
ncbi:MAG: hypothetical protein ACI90U_001877 [Pseudomonadales bacterium]|jgi:hypothetical protein